MTRWLLGVPAHVTVLHPFRAVVDSATASTVQSIAATTEAFDASFAGVGRFDDGGVVYLAPEPLEAFRQLTRSVVEVFPDYPPYGGAFPDPHPHLTVGSGLDRAAAHNLERLLVNGLPITWRVDVLTLLLENDAGQWSIGPSWPMKNAPDDTT